jgi:HSP20 family molecular chaperone IbpA
MASANEVTRQAGAAGEGKQSLMNAAPTSTIRPLVDIFETADGITLQADMPGVAKEGLNLRVDGPNLVVEGTIGIVPDQKMSAIHADVRSTLYRRSFVLGNELEAGNIDASLKDGVLTVRIPKRAEHRPRRIEIRN